MARVVALVSDLMLASRVEGSLRAAGHEVTVKAVPDAETVDADADRRRPRGRRSPRRSSRSARRRSASTPTSTSRRAARAEAAGFDVVVPRSRMARELPELVERLLAQR